MKAAGSRFLTTCIEQWSAKHGGLSQGAITIHPWGVLYNTKAISGAPPHPCGNGTAPELEWCARHFNASPVTTFWTATWTKEAWGSAWGSVDNRGQLFLPIKGVLTPSP